jgi:hypothetical protein
MTVAATILTLYPEMFTGPLGRSIAGRALAEGKWARGWCVLMPTGIMPGQNGSSGRSICVGKGASIV